MYDLVALRGEEHEDRVEQADEGPGREVGEESGGVPVGGEEGEEGEAREDCEAEGDAEEPRPARRRDAAFPASLSQPPGKA